jgi:hypothetical protein
MRWIASLFKENIGSVSLELVLYSGIMVAAIMLADELTQEFRFRNDVERAAATLADIMVNQRLPVDTDNIPETRTEILKRETDDPELALGLFSDMLGLYPDSDLAARITPGIRVTYLTTFNTDSDGKFTSYSWTKGIECPTENAPDLQDFANELKVDGNQLNTNLVMVETCTDGQKTTLRNFIFSPKYYSFFIAASES